MDSKNDVLRQERGWAGHYYCADKCLFRRNTLLTYNNIRIVVSTVGAMVLNDKIVIIGLNGYYETMAFHSDPTDKRYYDADVSKRIHFNSKRTITEPDTDADIEANEMHETVVTEITNRLLAGDIFSVEE